MANNDGIDGLLRAVFGESSVLSAANCHSGRDAGIQARDGNLVARANVQNAGAAGTMLKTCGKLRYHTLQATMHHSQNRGKKCQHLKSIAMNRKRFSASLMKKCIDG
jgi:hypothetical protein